MGINTVLCVRFNQRFLSHTYTHKAVSIRITVLWDMLPCRLVDRYYRTWGTGRLHLRSWRQKWAEKNCCLIQEWKMGPRQWCTRQPGVLEVYGHKLLWFCFSSDSLNQGWTNFLNYGAIKGYMRPAVPKKRPKQHSLFQ